MSQPQTSWGLFAESLGWCSLAILFVLSLWKPTDTAVSVGFGDSIWHIALSLLGFLSATFYAASLGRFGSSQRLSLLWLLIALVVLWHAMATGYSIGKSNLKNSIYGFWQSTSMWLLLPTIATLVRSPESAARLLKLWWVLAVFALFWGFWEYGVIQPSQRAELAKDRIGFLQRNKIDVDSSDAVLIINRIESTEVLSLFALANSYAGFLVAIWPLWLGWMLQGFRNRRLSRDSGSVASTSMLQRSEWLIPSILVLATALALLLTKSRTAWVATAVSTLLAFALDPVLRGDLGRWIKSNPMLIVGALIALLAVFGGVYALDPLIFQEAGKSLSYRMEYWRGAWELIGLQPMYGYGSLNFQPTYLQVKKISASETPADPHNFLLELGHSGGWILLGLTALLLFMLCMCSLRQRLLGSGGLYFSEGSSVDGANQGWVKSFRASVILCGLLVFAYAFFTAGDQEMIGTTLAIIASSAIAYWFTTESASASVQRLVMRQPVLLLVSFLGVMVHFLASGGWMFPGTMIAPMVAMGLWLAGSRWLETTDATLPSSKSVSKPNRFARWQGPVLASLIVGLWGWSMAWPYSQVQGVTKSFDRDEQGRLKIDSAVADKTLLSTDQYAAWVASVPHDPELAKWGMDMSATVLDSKLPTSEKISWLHQFQEACKLRIERDPKHSIAYAEAASQSLRASIGQMLDPSLNEELAMRRQGGGPPLRASGTGGGGGGRGRGPGAGGGAPPRTKTIATLLLQDSLRYYQEATKYAPASAELHLQTAAVAAMQGNWKVCEAMLDKAEEIDQQTPHRDRKIAATKIWIPREMVSVLEDRAKAAKKIPEEGSPEWDKLKILLDRSELVPGEPVRLSLRSFFKNP